MTRRRYLATMVAAAGMGVGKAGRAAANRGTGMAKRDRFGGWTGKTFEATGFFRTEHDGTRWWFVTPEGNAFISLGVNHYHKNMWTQDYNRAHWVKAFGATRPYDRAWVDGYHKAAAADCQRLGLNSLGIHTDESLLAPPHGPFLPYVRRYEPVDLTHYRNPKPENFVDVFDPAFVARCDAAAREMAEPFAADPMVLGYCMSDLPIFSDTWARYQRSTTWPRRLRNLSGDTPGKKAYMLCIRGRYADVAAFNAAYGTTFATWNKLAEARDWRPDTDFASRSELEDNRAFLLICVDKYYSVAKAALRRVDANHLFFGDKLNANGDCLETVVEVTSRYTDVISFQYYARWKDQEALLDRITAKAKKPFLNGDSSYAVPTEMAPAPHGTYHDKMRAKDQAERAAWTRDFCEGLFGRPDGVGWHMCGVIETWKTMKGKEKAQHTGIMTPTGEFFPEMEAAIQDVSARLYEIATGD
ncbi:MAG: hypothetical protein HN849_10080 [Victivallales bacterium]|nr:hypothetical protein [Victivallales bacterium]